MRTGGKIALVAIWMFNAFIWGFNVRGCADHASDRYIPSDSKVAAGYVAPSKLEVKCKDIDGRDGKETVLKVNGVEYLLKYDVDSVPRIYKFGVDSARVVPEYDSAYNAGGK